MGQQPNATGALVEEASPEAPLRRPPPHPSEWRTRPLMLRVADCGAHDGQQCGFNLPSTAFPVETDLFKGKMYFRFRGLPDEPKEYFAGKQRRLAAVVQGRVKRQIVMADCMTGVQHLRVNAVKKACACVLSALMRRPRVHSPSRRI